MTSTNIFNFVDLSNYFEENIFFSQEDLKLNFSAFSPDLLVFSNYVCDTILTKNPTSSSFIISYINQLEDIGVNSSVENITSIYHYSIPNTKLSYPEPFIASPSFMHSDL